MCLTTGRGWNAYSAEGLSVGSKIRLTMKKDERNVASDIESLDKHAKFARAKRRQLRESRNAIGCLAISSGWQPVIGCRLMYECFRPKTCS